jgi:hypothetical protein
MDIEKVNVLGVGVSVLEQDRARTFLFNAVRKTLGGTLPSHTVSARKAFDLTCENRHDNKLQ